MLECVPLKPEHIAQLAPRLREIDRKEIELVSGMTPEAGLEYSMRVSTAAWAWLEDGLVLCVFGVAPSHIGARWGSPWLLASDAAVARGRRLVRYCDEKIATLQGIYPNLYNMVHADNTIAIRWLRWCGFTMGQPVTVNGEPFIPFVRVSNVSTRSS